ncbi:MAG: aldolase [Alphaproteobacteria bacterium]|jgi:ribulose-5-phosphate 4-epimerase/fuculose-1-phosphate aldolase|nr:aldolase [Alphaproteobacteria bacterium]
MDLQQLRRDLAVALRWAARLGLNEGVDNHFSVAVADADGVVRGDRFLINPYGWHWSEITASAIPLCDAEGKVIDGDEAVEDTAFYIHSRVHLNVPSATVALHTHMPYATALTLLDGGRLEMCEQNALSFDGRIAYDDDYEGLALDCAEGDRLAAKMGNKSTLFMASHGILVTGPTIPEAFNDLYYLERAAMFQVLARSTGGKLRSISDQVRETARQQYASERAKVAERHFAALRRILDKEEPDYRH